MIDNDRPWPGCGRLEEETVHDDIDRTSWTV